MTISRYAWSLLIALLFVAGCRTATTPGSQYSMTGSYVDLLAEPTFDLGAGPPEGSFYSVAVPHNNADGHSVFDIPIVICEQLFFVPTWIFSWAYNLSSPGPYTTGYGAQGAPGGASTDGTVRQILGWTFAVPGVACYAMGFAATMAFDTVVHDVPVIVVGFPFRLVERFSSGG